MSMKTWTDAQKSAIETRGSDLLVSAAAGSGKTATLTERIIRLVTDEGADIDRMLIVTFTKAAAAELAERIGAALEAEAAAHPENPHLKRNAVRAPSADICTIHSFCYKLIGANFALLDLPCKIRVGDESELAILRTSAMEEAIDGLYAAEDPAFFELVDCVCGSGSDSRLSETLLSLAERLTSELDGTALLLDRAAACDDLAAGGDFFASPWGEEIALALTDGADHFAAVFDGAIAYFAGEERAPYLEKYAPAFASDRDFLARFRTALANRSCSDCAAIAKAYTPDKLKPMKSELQTEKGLFFKEQRGAFTKFISDAVKKYFSVTDAALRISAEKSALLIRTLEHAVRAYTDIYTAEKNRRGICDYADLERLTLRLLYGESQSFDADCLTPAAKEIAAMYDYVFVDEYQDTNGVQDAIFAAVGSAGERFLVGDVKQSIYSFRGASPEVFSHYREIFLPLSSQKNFEIFIPLAGAENEEVTLPARDENGEMHLAPTAEDTTPAPPPEAEKNTTGRSIFMANNFRCDRSVIDFANLVSDAMFPYSAVPYGAEDRLIFTKSESGGTKVRLCFIDTALSPADEDENAADTKKSRRTNARPGVDAEADYVAGEVEKLLRHGRKNDGTRIQPEDIAILLRSANMAGDVYASALARRGIPAGTERGAEFFETPEILLAISLLNMLDNPLRDIYLAAALRSPVFGFSLGELIEIRRAVSQKTEGDMPLIRAMEFYADETDSDVHPENNADSPDTTGMLHQKCRAFLDTLALWRESARADGADKILWQLYAKTGLLALCGEGGRHNLLALYEIAHSYENSVGSGLYGFVKYLEAKSEQGETLPSETGGVRIMSIHHSKGLEFPVCFLCDTARRFNRADEKNPVVFDSVLGAAMQLRYKDGIAKIDTLMRQAILRRIAKNRAEEEMRVLYVAMTRARERLIVTGKLPSPDDRLAAFNSEAPFASPYAVSLGSNYIFHIARAVAADPAAAAACADIRVVVPAFDEEDNLTLTEYPSSFFEGDGDTEDALTDGGEISTGDVENADEPAEISGDTADEGAEIAALTALFTERFRFRYAHEHLRNIPAKLTVSELYPDILDRDEEDTAARLVPVSAPAHPLPEPENDREQVSRRSDAAEAGTATHLFLQFADFDTLRGGADAVEAEIERLVKARFIDRRHGELIRRDHLRKFINSGFFARMCGAKKLWREFRFNIYLPADRFTDDEARAALLREHREGLLVQGVVDCMFLDAAGKLVLADYKTDYLTREELADPRLAQAKLSARHSRQLGYYRDACALMMGEVPHEVLVYSLPLGDTVEIF